MIQTNLPIHFTKTEILITYTSSCYGFITMAARAFNLKDTYGTAVTSNAVIWRCSNKWPLRINEQSTFCYLQVGMLEPNCFFIPVPGFFRACKLQFVCSDVKLKASRWQRLFTKLCTFLFPFLLPVPCHQLPL